MSPQPHERTGRRGAARRVAQRVRRHGRGITAGFLAFLMMVGIGSAAGYWAGHDTRTVSVAHADALGIGTRPAASATGSTVTVSWSASSFLSGASVDDYVVTRYDGNVVQTVHGDCAATVSALTCTEQSVPDGTWTYTITPASYLWRGTESPSRTVTVGTTHLTITTPARSTTAGASSDLITVRREDVGGFATTVGDLVVDLDTTHAASGAFRTAGDTAIAAPATVTIPDGASSVSFRYRDTLAGTATVTAVSGTLTSASQVETITPAPAAALEYISQPSTTSAGTAFAAPVTVRIVDAYSNTVASAVDTVSLEITAGSGTSGASLSCVLNQQPAVAGVATFSLCSIARAGIGYTLEATAAGLATATSTAFDITPAAASRLVFAQQPTDTTAGVGISPAPIVRVEDAYGNLTTSNANITVSFGANPGGATLSGTTTHAAVAGIASFSGLSLDKAAVGYTLSATAIGLTSGTSSSFTVTAAAAAQLAYAVAPSDAAAGASIAPSVVVEVRDAFGNRTNSNATITVAIGTNPAAGTLSGTSTAAAVNGQATFANLSIDKAAGGYTLLASSGGLTPATSGTFTITAGPASRVRYSVQPTDITAGASFAPAVAVRVEDAYGNLTSSSAAVTLSIGTNPGSGTLSGVATVNAVNGVATFSALTIDKAGLGYTLNAASSGLTGATSNAFDVTAGAAARLTFVQSPGSTVAGTAITPAVTVRVEDAYGNQTNSAAAVTVALATNPGAGTLSGTLTVNAVAGLATFGGLSVDKAASGYTLAATSSGLTSGTSAAFTITHASASALRFSTQPTGSTAGAAITPAVTVTVVDAFDNTVTASSAAITIAIGTNPATGTLSGTTNVNAVSGVATFPTLAINKAGAGYTLGASSGGLTPATSDAFGITAGAASQLTFSAQPTGTTATATITPAVTVRIEDANGNLTASTATVGIAIATNPGGGTLSGTISTAAVGGIATFSGLSIDKTGVGYTLAASSSGLTGATSSSFSIATGAASRLAFGTQPSNATAATAISPAVTVRVEDAGGNLVTTSSASITVAIGTNPGSGTLSGTVTVAASAGVATFSTLSINKSGTGYTLAASSGPLTGGTSGAFNVAAGAASKLTFSAQPTNTAAATAITPAVTVRIEDANGNLTTSAAAITVAIGTNPGAGTLSGTATVSAVAGVATFSNLSINKAGSGYTLTAASSPLTGATSSTFNITVGAASKLTFGTGPSNVAAGASISPAVTVRVEDAGGNLVTGSSASITIAIGTNPSTGTLSGTATVSAAAGIATFSNLSINRSGVGYTLTAASGVLTGATSAAFNVTAGGPAGITFTNTVMSNAATFSCTTSTPPAVVCATTALGNKGTFTANVALIDVGGNIVTNTTGAPISVTLAAAGGIGSVTPATVSIPVGASTSTATFTFTRPNGNSAAASLLASATVSATAVTATASLPQN